MKNKFLLLFICLPMLGMSQAIEMLNYEWDKNAAIHTLSAEEAKEPLVMILDERVIEYYWNKNDDIEQYNWRHRILRLNDNKAIEENNKIYIPVASPLSLISFKARSVSKTGAVK